LHEPPQSKLQDKDHLMLVTIFIILLTVNSFYLIFRKEHFYEAFIYCYGIFMLERLQSAAWIEIPFSQLASAMLFFAFYSVGNVIVFRYLHKDNYLNIIRKMRYYLALAASVCTLSSLLHYWQEGLLPATMLNLTALSYMNLILFVLFCFLVPKVTEVNSSAD